MVKIDSQEGAMNKMFQTKTRLSVYIKAFAAIVFAALVSFPAMAQTTYNIGALLPITGDLQAYGNASLKGVKLAVQQVNSQGGVLNGKLAVSVGDTQTKPQAGISAAQRLVSIDNVVGIVGAMSSGVTIPVSQSVTDSAGVALISPASTSPKITTLSDNDFLFRTVPSDAYQGVALGEVVSENNITNVGTMYINNDYGEGLANAFKDAFQKHGGTVSSQVAYDPGNASYRGEIAKASSRGAQALVLIGYPENGITILKQAIEGGYFSKFIFTDGMKSPSVIKAVGAQYLNGSFGTTPQALSDSNSAQLFRTAYNNQYGELPPQPYIDTAYDAAFVIAMALEKAGNSNPTAVRNALRSVANPGGTKIFPGEWAKAKRLIDAGQDVQYVGASGPVDFDKNGDVSGTFGYWVIKNGQIKTVRVFQP
jgi:ABC-type branched-subunit amino acid transport system substrate-binding protein